MFLPLLLAIWISLVLAGLPVSDYGFSLCVSTPGRAVLSQPYFSMEHCGTESAQGALEQDQLQDADKNRKDPVPDCSLVLVSWGVQVFRHGKLSVPLFVPCEEFKQMLSLPGMTISYPHKEGTWTDIKGTLFLCLPLSGNLSSSLSLLIPRKK